MDDSLRLETLDQAQDSARDAWRLQVKRKLTRRIMECSLIFGGGSQAFPEVLSSELHTISDKAVVAGVVCVAGLLLTIQGMDENTDAGLTESVREFRRSDP